MTDEQVRMICGCVYVVAMCAMLAFGLTSTQDPNPDDEYCDMVELYKQSNGENGWPAYKGEEVCTAQNQ
jgi:hypothetical protein